MKDLTTRIIEIVRSELASAQIFPPQVHADSTFADLRADDLARAGIALKLEDAFLIRVPDDEVEKWEAVSDIVGSVQMRIVKEVS